MNTQGDPPNNIDEEEFVGGLTDVAGNGVTKAVSTLTSNIASLESSLAKEKDERLEERFRWVCATAILFDVVAVAVLNGSWLFLPIFMLELIVLIGLAKAYGVDWAEQLIGELLYWVSKRGREN